MYVTLSVTATPTVINEGGTSTLTITASPAPMSDLTIPFTINGSGIVPDDYTLTVGGTALTALTGNVTLPMNQTSLALTLTSVDDADTIAETLTLTLNAGTGYTVSSTAGSAKVTINPFAQTAQFAASNVEVAENGGMVAVTVELSVPAVGATTIPIMTADDTATAGTDYTATTTNIVIADGATTGTAMIPIVNNDTYEADEAFTVSFGTLPSGVIAGASNRVNVVILDDEALTITGFSAATMSVEENVGTLVVAVEFGSALPAPLDIKYTWSAGTATLVDDFLPDHLQQSILVDTGATNFTLRAAIIDDGDAEDGETIFINLVSASRVRITNPAVTITINDDDSLSAGDVGFTTSAVNVAENAGMVEVTLRLGTAAASEIVIPIMTANGTATAGEDYTALSGAETMVTFASGEMSQTLSIPITNDIVLENDETFTVSLGSLPSGITAGARNSVTVTILNAVAVAQLVAPTGDVTLNEGQSVSITLRLTNVVPITTLLIDGTVSDISGDFGGNTEYTWIDPAGTALSRGDALELSTAGGVDEWTFMLMANDDSDTQTESADFELSAQADFLNEAGASVRRIFFNRTFRLTINPAGTVVVPALSVAAAPTTITEGAASTITITAATAPADDLTIPYTIAGTGIATGDYTLTDASGTELTGLTGNITLAGSATSVALTLTAADDSDASAEMLTFTLGAGTGYTVATATATITIDPAVAATLPTVQFSAATTATVAEGDGTVVLTLELSEAVTEEFQVTVNTNGLTASFRDDYMSAGSVIFAVGDTMQTVSIPIVDDDVVETDETFRASISALDPCVHRCSNAGHPDSS